MFLARESLPAKLALRIAGKSGWIALSIWLVAATVSALRLWHADMAGIYLAAHFYSLGQTGPIYPVGDFNPIFEVPPEWSSELVRMGLPGKTAFPYVYPPLWAALLAPATVLTPYAFFKVTLVLQAALIPFSVLLARKIAGGNISVQRWTLVSAALLFINFPAYFALILNQPQITLVFLTLLGAWRLRQKRDIQAGLLFGLVAAIKITPLIFVVMLLLLHRWRALAAMAGFIAAFALASVLVCGIDLNMAFVEKLRLVSDYAFSSAATYNFAPLMLSFAPASPELAEVIRYGSYSTLAPLWIRAVTSGLLLFLTAGLVVIVRGQDDNRRILALTAGLTIIAALAGPFGWAHYFLLPVLLSPIMLFRATGIWKPGFLAAAVLLPSLEVASRLPVFATQSLGVLYFLCLLIAFARLRGETDSRLTGPDAGKS